MALALTEEHRALAEAVQGLAGRLAPLEAVRPTLADGDRGAAFYLDTLRPALAAQGLFGLHLPESLGGQGYGVPELAVAAEALGRALVPGGYLPTVLASAVLARAAAARPDGSAAPLELLVEGLAAGARTGAVALADGITAEPAAGDDGALVIEGRCGPVPAAELADLIILPITRDGQRSWVALDAADVRITAADSLDLTRPCAQVLADRVVVPAERVLDSLPTGLVESLSATLFGAEACGIADWAVSTAAEYAKVRHQFGRPIGQFQAVKHRCARMLTAAEQAAASVWDAARAQHEGDRGAGPPVAGADGVDAARQSCAGRDLAACVAAVVALDAAITCAHECIQVLGGIGYTWEHNAHLYYRRALTLRALLGRSSEWARRAADLALGGAQRPLGVDLPAEAEQVRARIGEDLAAIALAPAPQRAGLLADGGWAAPHLPRPWGRDASPLEQIVIDQQMRAVGLRQPALSIGAWVIPALVQYGTPEQRQRFLPATLRGEIIWCQLFSEPGAGSDLAGLSTRAVRAEGGWRITGQKIWTSLAKEAAWAICVARTNPDAPRHDGITYFLVDMSSPGLTVRPLREMTGDAVFNEVFLDEVFVPDDLVVGEVDDGWRVARTTLANERVSLSQGWAFGCGVPQLLETVRQTGGRPDYATLQRTGELVCEGRAIDLLGLRVALKRLSGTDPGATGSVRKLLSMRHAQQIAEECWSLSGPDGALDSGGWTRALLFTRALTIGGGTTDIQLNIIAERILGLPRDPFPGA